MGRKDLPREGNEKTNAGLRECRKDEKSSSGSRDEQTGCQHNIWGERTMLTKGLDNV